MLIIPSLAIQEMLCTTTPVGEEGTVGKYPRDPVAVARMWRSENAKAIHVVDIDGAYEGKISNKPLLRELTYAVDIPIQLSGGLRTYEDVKTAFDDLGIFRVVLGTSAFSDPELVNTLIQEFGPRKIVVSLDISEGKVLTHGRQTTQDFSPVAAGLEIKNLGVQRIVYHDIGTEERRQGPAFDTLREFAVQTGLNVTVHGMVRHYADLATLQTVYPTKIDSLILGEPLYINAFPCQRIWRIAEKELIDQHRFF